MTSNGRNLIVLSDGTGNSAAAASKTKVWRLYQALDLTDGTQIAAFSDGVGTSNIKPLRILGQALGFGVQRNVLRLYKFLCRNYVPGDQIWAFGFSRGAFTIRVLVGLIAREGLVCWETEADLDRNALAAYRSFREKAFKSSLPWVNAHRWIRDRWSHAWNWLTKRTPYTAFGTRQTNVRFVGVWDTVAAYGLPIDELTQAFDKCVWPLSFRDTYLWQGVEHARHALSLEDDRKTFFPIPWDETHEKALIKAGTVLPGRLRQVWFAGAHADVGGGYPDDGLSLVPLGWMIREAAEKELRFMQSIVAEFAALANPTGRVYDPRSGFGALYRYQPRDAQKLLGEGNTPLVAGRVMTRIASGTEGYAPISLPEKIEVLPHYGPPVAFTPQAVASALNQVKHSGRTLSPADQATQQLILENTLKVAVQAGKLLPRARSGLFELVHDTVWWRRINYFVSLGFVLIAVAFPIFAKIFPPGQLDTATRGPVGSIIDLANGFLPWFLEPWISAVRQHPVAAVSVLLGLILNLRVSASLQGRIRDHARAAWNMGIKAQPLRPTGRRGTALSIGLTFGGLAIGALSTWFSTWAARVNTGWIVSFSVGAAVFLALWLSLRREGAKPQQINPAKPGFLLSFARKMRTAGWSVAVYKLAAEKIAPAACLALGVLGVLALGHRVAFDLLSAGGAYCTNTKDDSGLFMTDLGEEKLDVSPEFKFNTGSMCQATGIRLVEGRKYRIQIEMREMEDAQWFDKRVRTDVAGFATDSWRHFFALPLKRWWRENWFQPIARIGKVGNSEHVLQPAAPLTAMLLLTEEKEKKCNRPRPQKDEREKYISSPVSEEFRTWELDCEAANNIQPNRMLISDITSDATGELFLYVNDAVLSLPASMNIFYQNNIGTAKVTVARILADSIETPANENKVQTMIEH